MELWERTWKSSDAAAAVGMDLGKFKLWISRGYPAAEGMEGGGSQGRHRLFSFRNIMEFAVARALTDQGIPPGMAFSAARVFAYSAVNPISRCPGLPLHPDNGETIVAMAAETVVIGYTPTSRDSWADFLGDLAGQENFFRFESFMCVNATAVFRNVCIRLGLNHHDILDKVYERGPYTQSAFEGD